MDSKGSSAVLLKIKQENNENRDNYGYKRKRAMPMNTENYSLEMRYSTQKPVCTKFRLPRSS